MLAIVGSEAGFNFPTPNFWIKSFDFATGHASRVLAIIDTGIKGFVLLIVACCTKDGKIYYYLQKDINFKQLNNEANVS